MQPVKSQLAKSGVEQATLRVAVAWCGAHLSGRLHQDAAMIDLFGRFWEIVVAFYVSKVGDVAGVEVPIARYEAEDHCVSSGSDPCFGADLEQKLWVVIA